MRENPLGGVCSHSVFGVDRLSPPRKWPPRWRWDLGHLSEADTPSSQNWANSARVLLGGYPLKAGGFLTHGNVGAPLCLIHTSGLYNGVPFPPFIPSPRLARMGVFHGYPGPSGVKEPHYGLYYSNQRSFLSGERPCGLPGGGGTKCSRPSLN